MQRSYYLGLNFPLARGHSPASSSSLIDAAIIPSVAHGEADGNGYRLEWHRGLLPQILYDNEKIQQRDAFGEAALMELLMDLTFGQASAGPWTDSTAPEF